MAAPRPGALDRVFSAYDAATGTQLWKPRLNESCRRATVEAAVSIESEGEGFRISRSALTLRAQVPNLGQAAFAQMISGAEKNCPVSKVLNAPITVDANLTSI
jgi:hypothetical protein